MKANETIEVFAQPPSQSKLFKAKATFELGSGKGDYQLLVECDNPVWVYEYGEEGKGHTPIGSANVSLYSVNNYKSVCMDFEFWMDYSSPTRIDIEESMVCARPVLRFEGSIGGLLRMAKACVGPISGPLVHYTVQEIILSRSSDGGGLVSIVEESQG